MDHKTREVLVRQQTRMVNAIRAPPGAFGIVVSRGIHGLDRLLSAAEEVPEAARPALDLLAAQLRDTRIADVTRRIEAAQAEDALARRLATVPGIGVLTAGALAATTPEVGAFRSARDCAAWPGVPSVSRADRVPARTPKAGNRDLRRLLFLGASCRGHASGVMSQIRARRGRKPATDRLSGMVQKTRVKLAAIALANRMARVVRALIRSGESDRANPG